MKCISIEPKKDGVSNNTIFYIMFIFTFFKIRFAGADSVAPPPSKKMRERERERERREEECTFLKREQLLILWKSVNVFFLFYVQFSCN